MTVRDGDELPTVAVRAIRDALELVRLDQEVDPPLPPNDVEFLGL